MIATDRGTRHVLIATTAVSRRTARILTGWAWPGQAPGHGQRG